VRALRELLVAARGTVTVVLRRSGRASLGAALGFAAVVGMAVVALSILALPSEDESGLAPPAALPVTAGADAQDQPAPAAGPGPGTSGEPVAGERPDAADASVASGGDAEGVAQVSPPAPASGEDLVVAGASSPSGPDPSGTPVPASPGPAGATTTTSAPRPGSTTTTQPPPGGDGGVLVDLLGALGLRP
jgi:hypothetical protein